MNKLPVTITTIEIFNVEHYFVNTLSRKMFFGRTGVVSSVHHLCKNVDQFHQICCHLILVFFLRGGWGFCFVVITTIKPTLSKHDDFINFIRLSSPTL